MECGVRAPAGEHKTTIDLFFTVIKRYNSYKAVSQVTAKLYSFASKKNEITLYEIIEELEIL